MSSAGVTSTTVRDFFGSTPESIKVKPKTVEKASVKNEVVKEHLKESLTLRMMMFSPISTEPDLELTFTPLPSKNGQSILLTRYNGNGLDQYTKDFTTWEPIFDELKMCLRLQRPSSVSLGYKGLTYHWKCQETLQRLLVEQRLLRTMNNHDCEINDCDPDSHDVDNGDFWNFIIDKAQAIIHETMEYDGKYLWKVELLRDKECPVLLEPLRPGATHRLPCSHFISTEAFYKLVCPRKCPMCRADVSSSGTECI